MSHVANKIKDVCNWRLFIGLCVRRPAVIVPKLLPIEKQVKDTLCKQEFENSHLSLHEYNQLVEEKQIEKAIKEGTSTGDSDSLLTSREKEIVWESEAERFDSLLTRPVNYHLDNKRTTLRILDSPLILLQQHSKGFWTVPIMPLDDGQTLREVALKLSSFILPELSRCNVIGNAPSAVYIKTSKSKNMGSQTYFFNAYVSRLWNGEDVILREESKDFAWVTKSEMQSLILNRKFRSVLNSFIHEY